MLVFLRHSMRQDRIPSPEVQWTDKSTRPYDTPISDAECPALAVNQITEVVDLADGTLVCSPFRRCLQTCAVAARSLSIAHVVIDDRLGEDSAGVCADIQNAGLDVQQVRSAAQYISDEEIFGLLPNGVTFEHHQLTESEVRQAAGSTVRDVDGYVARWQSSGGRLFPGNAPSVILSGIEHWLHVAAHEPYPVLVVSHLGVLSLASSRFKDSEQSSGAIPHEYCSWLVVNAHTGTRQVHGAPQYEQADSAAANQLMSLLGCSASIATAALMRAEGDLNVAAAFVLEKPAWLVEATPSLEAEAEAETAPAVETARLAEELKVPPGTAYERGVFIAQALEPHILGLYELKLSQLLGIVSEEQWQQVATNGIAQAKIWTPAAYEELRGMASVVGWKVVGRLACYYEMEKCGAWVQDQELWTAQKVSHGEQQPDAPHSACTSFGIVSEDCIVCGQNNDECSFFYAPDGQHVADVVLRLEDADQPSVLTYTHCGMIAKMGVNSVGLAIMSLAIHDDERNLLNGVPFSCVCREVLSKESLPEAVDLMRQLPRTFPNCYVVSQPGYGVHTIECTPGRFVVEEITDSWTCHGNNILLLRSEGGGEAPRVDAPGRYKSGSKECCLATELQAAVVAAGGCGMIGDEQAVDLLARSQSFGWEWTLSQMVFCADANGVRCHLRFHQSEAWLDLGFG